MSLIIGVTRIDLNWLWRLNGLLLTISETEPGLWDRLTSGYYSRLRIFAATSVLSGGP